MPDLAGRGNQAIPSPLYFVYRIYNDGHICRITRYGEILLDINICILQSCPPVVGCQYRNTLELQRPFVSCPAHFSTSPRQTASAPLGERVTIH